MKNVIKIILLMCLGTSGAWAQHIGVKVTNKGIQNLFVSAINSYGGDDKNLKKIIIEKGIVYNRIKKEFFDTDPLIAQIREYVNFEQNKDLRYFFRWSPITVDTNLVPNSLKVNVSGEEREFEAAIKFSLNKLRVSGRYLELCELRKGKCNKKNALYGRFNGYSISLKRGKSIDIAAVVKVKVSEGNVEVKLKHFITNLKQPATSIERSLYNKYEISTSHLAQFDIAFNDFIIPPPMVTINGETFELDVSKLKDAILKQKQYLSSQLASFAGEFITKDLTTILNKDFFNKLKDLKTTVSLLNYEELMAFEVGRGQFSYPRKPIRGYNTVAIDNTYVAPRVDYRLVQQNLTGGKEVSFMDSLQGALKMFVHQAQFDLIYLKTKTKNDKDLVVDFSSDLILNDKKWKLGTSLRNGKGTLKYPNFEELDAKKYDVAVALSEPMFNGILDLASKEKLIQNIIDEVSPMEGVYINSVKMHFEQGKENSYSYKNLDPAVFNPQRVYNPKTQQYKTIHFRTQDAIVVVVNLKINLYEQPADGIGGWISNQIGGLLEKGWVWFPLEVKFYPQIITEDDKTYIELYASSPFGYNGLRNTYGYPYKDMKNIVHKGLIKKLKEMLKPTLEDLPRVDISNYLSFPGIKLQPLRVYVKKTGHLLISANITKLDLRELSEIETKKE